MIGLGNFKWKSVAKFFETKNFELQKVNRLKNEPYKKCIS